MSKSAAENDVIDKSTEVQAITDNESADSKIEKKSNEADAINESKDQQENLRAAAIDQKIQNTDTQIDIRMSYTEFMYELNLRNLDGYLKAIGALLFEVDNAIKDCKNRTGLSKAGKETLKNTRRKLNEHKKTLETKQNLKTIGTNPEVYNDEIKNLQQIRNDVQQAKQDIARGQLGQLSDTAGYTYNSPENARQSNRSQEHMQEFNRKLQQEVRQGAVLNIFNGNEQNATNFYRRIAEGNYSSADYIRYTTNASILNGSFQRCGIEAPTQQGVRGYSPIDRATGTYPDYSNTSRSETFQQGGVAGAIDKLLSNCNNLTPGQRNTWKTIGVLAGFGAGIFGLVKFYKSSKLGFWGKAGITAGAILGSQILTGEGPLSLFNKLMTGGLSFDQLKNSFGNAISGIGGSGIESSNTIAPAMYSMMIFNSSTKVGDINTMTQGFKSDNNLRKEFYNESINKLQGQYGGQQTVEYFRANFSETFDEQKWNNRLASFGVVDISNPANSGKLIYELANNATMNEIILERFRSENGVKETSDRTKKNQFRQYINSLKTNNQALNMQTLEQHKYDWFEPDLEATYTERPEDIQNKNLLVSQVNDLSIDETKKNELRTAIQVFYDKRTIESKPVLGDFSLELNSNGSLTVISHEGHRTQINLRTRRLEGLDGEHSFASLDELINAADITNKILLSQRGKTPVKLPAFEYKSFRGGIYFNDAETISTNFDTRVLSNWWWKSARKINPIYRYPNEYATYLSKRRLEAKTVEINPTLYPTVKRLSEKAKIVFTDENEVKELEAWLNKIKNDLKDFYATPKGSPFRISWQLKTIDKKLVFVAIDGEKMVFSESISDKFPTILNNSEKFLDFMNDVNNGMYNPGV